MHRLGVALLTLALFALPVRADDNWPAFRGGASAGVAEAKTLPDVWDKDKGVVWSVAIPGQGWSSPVVWGERVFVTSVQSDKELPESKKGLYINDLQGKVMPGEHRWLVHCLDFKIGKVLWTREAHKGVPTTRHIKNSYASETPVTDGERVYAYFGNVGLFCYDFEGKLQWSQKLGTYKTRMGWGTAASPALEGDKVFVVHDNEEHSFLVALEKKTGKEWWRVERDEKSNWATPFVWKHALRTEIVTAGTNKVRSYDPDGKLLWELAGMSVISIPTPFASEGLLYVTSGYVMDSRMKPVYAIRPGASGDVSLGEDTSNKWVAWSQRQAGPYHPTPLVYGDYLYVLYDRGMLSCFEAKTGKLVYDRQKLDKAANAFTASPWAYDGKIFCLSEDGDTIVVQAGKEFKVLGKNSLDEMCMATPALAHGSLILRTASKLYRIEKK
jgi:outer membrane protein assembly factor BamB